MAGGVKKKLMIVGDGVCGKTSMLLRFKGDDFIEEHIPTICNDYVLQLKIDNTPLDLCLFDTSGQAEYEHLRQLSYKNTNVVVVVFSIADPDSLDNVLSVWVPEVRHHLQDVPIVLVGNKSDLRHDKDVIFKLRKRQREPVKRERGEEVAKEIKAVKYLECSAKLSKDVITIKTVFNTAAKASLQTKKKGSCLII